MVGLDGALQQEQGKGEGEIEIIRQEVVGALEALEDLEHLFADRYGYDNTSASLVVDVMFCHRGPNLSRILGPTWLRISMLFELPVIVPPLGPPLASLKHYHHSKNEVSNAAPMPVLKRWVMPVHPSTLGAHSPFWIPAQGFGTQLATKDQGSSIEFERHLPFVEGVRLDARQVNTYFCRVVQSLTCLMKRLGDICTVSPTAGC